MRRMVLVAAAFAFAGCIFEPNLTNVRVCAYDVEWTGMDVGKLPQGLAYTFEATSGTSEEPQMGPLFFGAMFTVQRLDDGPSEVAWEYRAGIRALSSMLDHPTRSYPYAVVGSYFGWFEDDGEDDGALGVGIEGGFGARLGFGDRAAMDFEFLMSYGHFFSADNLLSTRLGGAVTMQW